MQKLRKILLFNKLYYFLLLISLIYALINNVIIKHYSVYKVETNFIGIIDNFNIDGDKVTIQIKAKETIQGTYYLKSVEEKDYFLNNLKYGSKVELNGELNEPSNNTLPNTFNYKKYLYNKGIYKTLNIDTFKILSNKMNFFYKFKNTINDHINKIDNYGYIKTFILGDKNNIDYVVFNNYQTLGVTHLFAISGMHIGLFTLVIIFILKKLNLRENTALFIAIIIIGIYGALTGFPASIRRAYVLFLLVSINKIFDFNVKTFYLLILTIVINILLNSFIIYDIGFLYSSITTAGLIISSAYLKNGNYFIKLLKVSVIAYIFSMPITINNFYEINLMSPINNLFIVPLVSLVIYPLSLAIFLFPNLSFIFNLSINLLQFIESLLIKINVFTIAIPKLSLIFIIIYYILLLLIILKRKMKLIIVILIMLIFQITLPYFDKNSYIYFLDVGQGDSCLIITPYKKSITVIDTGGKLPQSVADWQIKNKNYHISDNVITFMHSLGLKSIDNLILSHGDADHMGEAINLVNNFNIKNVVFNVGPYNSLENDLIKILESKKIKHFKDIKTLTIDKYQLLFLNTSEYDNENDNSSVVYLKYNNYKLLFMGDAGIIKEKDILDKYKLNDIDFLKVGHHGSNTSSSEIFINSINPKNCLISVGKNNRYGHPKESVLNILKDCNIYRTDMVGSIKLKLNKNKYMVKTYSP